MTITVPDFTSVRVLVVGDSMLDEYWFGDTGRISPEAPVPVVRTVSADSSYKAGIMSAAKPLKSGQ